VSSHPKGASAEGVRDLSGNVAEWVRDWYGPYAAGEIDNPQGPASGKWRVIRGGSYISSTDRARVQTRDYARPELRSPETGLRCVKEL
jgi:formylglycine-generating enzyme required for sulfatase activity